MLDKGAARGRKTQSDAVDFASCREGLEESIANLRRYSRSSVADSDQDGLAWAAYGVAALVTVAMPVVPWFFLRQLHQLIA